MYRQAVAKPAPNAPPQTRHATLPKAIVGFLVFGLPAAYVAVFGRYPGWGRGAAAFGAKKRPVRRR